MDRQILKQLPELRREIQKLERAAGRAERRMNAISLMMPLKKYNERLKELQKKKALMEKKRTELLQIEKGAGEYIQSIEDSSLSRIIRYRYMDDLSWQQVAAQMGHRYSEESCRKKVERFMSDRETGQ